MNETILRAMKINEKADFKTDLPFLEIGDELYLKDLLEDGDAETEILSYLSKSYKIDDNDWINYEFEIIEEDNEKLINTLIKITDIYLL